MRINKSWTRGIAFGLFVLLLVSALGMKKIVQAIAPENKKYTLDECISKASSSRQLDRVDLQISRLENQRGELESAKDGLEYLLREYARLYDYLQELNIKRAELELKLKADEENTVSIDDSSHLLLQEEEPEDGQAGVSDEQAQDSSMDEDSDSETQDDQDTADSGSGDSGSNNETENPPDEDEQSKEDIQGELDKIISQINEVTNQLAELAKILAENFGLIMTGRNLTRDQEFQVKKMFDFPIADLDTAITNMSLTKEVTLKTIESQIRQAYDGILSLMDALELQEKILDIRELQYERAKIRADEGRASLLEVENADGEAEKARLNVDITKRNIENMKIALKRLTGIDISREIKLKYYDVDKDNDIESYYYYLKRALSSRAEIEIAENDFKNKENQMDVTRDYKDSSTIEYREARVALLEKEYGISNSKNSVTRDIKAGYDDVINKKAAVNLAKEKLNYAEAQYEELEAKYDQGLISQSVLLDSEINVLQSEYGYKKALRDFALALYKLDLAKGIGPKYQSQMGGNIDE